MPIPKKQKKEEPQALAALESSTSAVSASSSVICCDNIIEEIAEEVKDAKATSDKKDKKDKKRGKNKSGLVMESTVSDLAIKVYLEQCPAGFDVFVETVRNIDKVEWHIMAILHDKDLDADEIYEAAYKKPHFHILVLKQGKDKENRQQRRKISTILNMLGIVFRPGVDDIIWEERGVERIKDIGGSVMYLTHETEKAQQEGKELYDRSAIITNLERDEVQQYREGYTRALDHKRRYSNKERAEVASDAYTAGYTNSQTWEEFEAALPYPLQKGADYNLFVKRFQEGVDKRMEEHPEIPRMCVFIEGPPNVGKTYAARHAFDGLGLSILQVTDGTKTAKLDKLKESHNVLLVDDAKIPDVLNMCDNRACQVYKRNSGSPYWCGDAFIVTSNDSFDDWAKYCGVNKKQLEALRSRFFVCQVVQDENGTNYIDVISHTTRGTKEEQEAKKLRFKEFLKNANSIMAQYRPEEIDVDYSDVMRRL